MSNNEFYGIDADFLNIFGKDFDRLAFPNGIYWIAGGCGGNGILICGSEKNAVIDCGMAYCADETIENIRKYTDKLDYIICSHSHYDHIGAIPYLLDAFDGAIVCGSPKCERVFKSENAKKFIKMMGENARDLYSEDSSYEIRTDNLNVDMVLNDGDEINLGDKSIRAFMTKGHTDCSMTFMISPYDLMITSESTGIIETMNYIHTPILKSFDDARESVHKCIELKPRLIFIPHFGLIPETLNDKYFQMFLESCNEKMAYVKSMLNDKLSCDEMRDRFIDRYKIPSGEKLQPFKAYAENAEHLLDTLIEYVKGGDISDYCLKPKEEIMFDAERVKNDVVKWIQDWFEENGKGCNAVVGLSGGKDSSIVAALCVEALGKDRVVGVMMPNGEQFDIDVSHALVKHLDIKGIVMNIKDAYQGILGEINREFGEMSAQAKTNLPPRLRMTMLYAVSQNVNGRVANTCNLSEDWVGYNTRYGDSAGDFSPLSRLTVQEVKAIGRVLGLPSMFVDKTPIDGLQDKTDEDNLGFTYAVLDKYIREGVCDDPEIKEKIDYKHKTNLFKLELMPTFEYKPEDYK